MKIVEDPSLGTRLIHLSLVIPVVFRTTLKEVEQGLQKKVATQFVRILKEYSGVYVPDCELEVFKISDVIHLSKGDIQLVKDHIFDQLQSGPRVNSYSIVCREWQMRPCGKSSVNSLLV